MARNARFWIDYLQLAKHPEGGYFREIYRSNEFIHKKSLPDRYTSFRSFSTSIYYLLENPEYSAFHRLKSDEIWHFYEGSSIQLYIVLPNGEFRKLILGKQPEEGQYFQAVIPKGCWFAAHVSEPKAFALVGCSVSPGFDFEDLEMGSREKLLKRFPQHSQLITKFTRNS